MLTVRLLIGPLVAVILSFRQQEVIRCPDYESIDDRTQVVQNADGTYLRVLGFPSPRGDGRLCLSPERTWREEWTDLPERGGQFLRQLEEPR